MNMHESAHHIEREDSPPIPQDTTDYAPPEEAYEPEWVVVHAEQLKASEPATSLIAKSIQDRQNNYARVLEAIKKSKPDFFTDIGVQIEYLENVNQVYGALTILNDLIESLPLNLNKGHYRSSPEKSTQLALFDIQEVENNSGMCYNRD